MNLFRNIKADLPASIVVLFVAVPLCLGIAVASNAPPFAGLLAGIIGGIIVGSLSGSQLGVSGPAAGLAVIVYGAIGELGYPGFLVAVVIGGALQILFGLLRAGFIAFFFPTAVIRGMLSGIGIIIILKQIPHAFGHDSDPEGELSFQQPDHETTLSSFKAMLPDFDGRVVLVSMTALLILILWETVLSKRFKLCRLIQGPLVAVAFGILYQAITRAEAPDWALADIHLVDVPEIGSFSELKASLTMPKWSRIGDGAVWVIGATMAIVASLETLLCVEATDKLDPHKRVTPTNRELLAQGVGNVCAGLVGGLPITQVIVRSSANIQSGGQTKLAAILHGVFLLVFVFALPKVLNLLPLAVLASILFVVGYKLAKPAVFKKMYALGRPQFLPFVVTILGIVFTDLLTGIGLGLGVAIIEILWRSYKNSHFLHMKEAETADHRHTVSIKLAEEVTFLNRGAILKALNGIPDGSDVTIDATETMTLDHDVIEVIEDFRVNAEERGITLDFIRRPERAA